MAQTTMTHTSMPVQYYHTSLGHHTLPCHHLFLYSLQIDDEVVLDLLALPEQNRTLGDAPRVHEDQGQLHHRFGGSKGRDCDIFQCGATGVFR